MSSILKKLEENRTPILLAEIGAYLHDLGKARNEFIEHYTKNGKSSWDGHNFPSLFRNIPLLNEITIEVCSKKVTFMDFIEKHHEEKESGGEFDFNDIPNLVQLLYAKNNGYDGIDSGVDKGKVSAKQSKNNIFISSAFGYEPMKNKIESEEVKELTKNLYEHVQKSLSTYLTNNKIITIRREIIEGTKKYYLKFLGETRRAANDVTLWDHSYSVATLLKCAVAKIVMNQKASFYPLAFDWRILSINLNVLSALSKGIKIGDIKGYEGIIYKIFRRVKSFVEEIYPIGNEIYRDTSGIYFLIADIDTKELEKELYNKVNQIEPELMISVLVNDFHDPNTPINYHLCCNVPLQNIPNHIKILRKNLEEQKKEKLIKILPAARKSALEEIVYPLSSQRVDINKFIVGWENKEICPICRLRIMEENSDGCEHCLERRIKRAKDWIKNLKETSKETIWLDEVSDHNDRVALIIGSFILDNWLDGTFIKTMAIKNNHPESKHPSPARIRRIWNTTQEFIKESILRDILPSHSYASDYSLKELRNKRIQFTISPAPKVSEGSTVDIDIEGIRLSPVCINSNDGIFVTTTNLQILSKKGNTINEIASWMNGKDIKLKMEGEKWTFRYRINNATYTEEKFQNYLPNIPIYDFPDQFMVLVPAYDALEIASKIYEEYEIQFSKVRDRLPFHIGIIGFHRRTPLYIAMDASKRLIEAYKKNTRTINATLDTIKDINDNKFGKYAKKIVIKTDSTYSSTPLAWKISYSTGDPDQQDEWHPYIRINGGNSNRGTYSFDYTGRGNFVVHIKEIKPNDNIQIETSLF